jgi:hypothetical protein
MRRWRRGAAARLHARAGLLLLAGGLAAPLSAAAQDVDQPFAALAGDWDRHGFGLTVDDDGTAAAVWRVYRWCGPGVPQPCDLLTDNRIISGGRADITFTAVDDAGALQGQVSHSTDDELLVDGPVSLSPLPDGMAHLAQGATQLDLCGPHFLELASPEVVDQLPCGA